MILEIAFGSPRYAEALVFREALLRRPLGLGFSAGDLAGEAEQIHIAAIEDEVVVGTVVLKPVSAGVARLRQMAVAPDWRRSGLGSDLVRFAETVARQRDVTRIELHARVAVEGFYAGLGYARRGDPFVELTIPHVAMAKSLPAETLASAAPA